MKRKDWLRDALTCKHCGAGLILIDKRWVACKRFDHMKQTSLKDFLSTVEAMHLRSGCRRDKRCIRRLATRVLNANAVRFEFLLNPPVASSSPASSVFRGLFDSVSNQEAN